MTAEVGKFACVFEKFYLTLSHIEHGVPALVLSIPVSADAVTTHDSKSLTFSFVITRCPRRLRSSV